MEFRFRAGEMESLPFFDCPPPPPPPLPSPNLFPRKPMQGSVNPRPSLEELEKELKEEKIREEITACRIAQRRMIEEQVRREMEIGHEGSFPSMELLDQKLTTTEKTANTKISNTTFKFLRPEQEDISSHLAKAPLFSSIETSTKHALVKEDCGYTGSILTPAVAANKPEGLEVHACSEENVTIQVNGKSYEVVEKGIYLLCSLCGVQCSNRDVMASHLSGKKHLLKEWRKGNKPEAAESEAVEEEKYHFKEVNKNWIRDLCQVEFPGKVGLSDHLRGKKHRAKSASASDKPAKSAEVEDKNGSSLMPMDTCEGTKVSTKEENLSLLKREASDEEKFHVKEVNGIWICNICQVIVPGPDKQGFNIHLTGKKHKAKSTSARASNDRANSTTEEDNDGSSLMPMDMQGGTTMSTKFESLTLLKREGLEEEKYHFKEVNKIWICDLCQVEFPGKVGLSDHLRGKKHHAKSAFASDKPAKSAEVEDKNGSSSMPMDTCGGTKVSTKEENLSLLKREASAEEKFHVKEVNGIWICNICQVIVPRPDKEGFNIHLTGKKHKAKSTSARASNDRANSTTEEDNDGSSLMPMDMQGGTTMSTKFESSTLLKREGLEEEKYHFKEVNKIWICDLCQVEFPGKVGLSDHLRGKKHRAKSAFASDKPAKSAEVEDKNGSSSMPMDTCGGTKVSTKEENLSLLKREASDEEKFHVKEVNGIWICNICQVIVPGPDKEGFNIHLMGKKHKAKSTSARASNDRANSTTEEDNDGSSWMPMDMQGGTTMSTKFESVTLLKREGLEEEKYHVKEVNKIWICDLCQVIVPGPDKEGFYVHLIGKKHLAKSAHARVSNELPKSAAVEGNNGPSSMSMDTEGGTKVRTNEEYNLALLKKEALEEKYHVKQVNNIWICDLCQVNVPSPDLENFNVHLKGKKHQAKLVHLSVINDLAKLAAVEDNNGSSSMPTDAHGGIKVSAYKEEEQLSILKEALEEKYHAKEVNNIWICDLCKVNVPRPDSDGFKDHLRGKKHKAKLEQLSVINEPAKSATIEYKNCCVGSSLMPMDIQEGTEASVGVENSSLVKKKAIEEGKYYVTEVKESLISHLCQVEMPIEGINVHLGGKKHQVKTVPLIASIELSNPIIKDNNGCSGSSSMLIDAPGGIKESTEGEGNSSLVKKEATAEEKYLVKEVTKNWICDLCQVSVPRPGTEGFNAHLRGRKHRVKSDSNKLTPLAALGDTLGCDGSSLIQIDTKIINRG